MPGLDDILAAIADPLRREIIGTLATGERSVNELAERFPVSRPAVSKHLRVLREAGLVAERSEGRFRYYRLESKPFTALDDWLAPYRRLWPRQLQRLKQHIESPRRKQ